MPDDPSRGRLSGYHGRFWPHPDVELLLKASLFADERGRLAWQDVRPRFDLDRAGGAVYHILPMLYRNLVRLRVDDPLMGRLRGLHRRSWYQNQLLLRELRTAIGLLEGAGIPTMALKGAAFLELYYRDSGARFMNDVDVLVPITDRDAALRVLQDDGWNVPPAYYREVSTNLFRDNGRMLDLHWHLLAELLLRGDPDGSSADLWAAAREVEVAGAHTRTLCPADQLLHTLVHGSLHSEAAHLRWIADATTLLTVAGDDVDWERFLRQVRRRRVVVCVREMLGYLSARFDAKIPPHVERRLRWMPAGPWQTLLHVARTDPERVDRVAVVVRWYLESEAPYGTLPQAVVRFPRYLQRVWGVPRLRRVPAEAGRRATLRLRRAAGTQGRER